MLFSLRVKSLKLFLHLPVIYGSDANNNKDSNNDGDALDPIYWWSPSEFG